MVTVRLQDTLSGELQELCPRDPGKVSIYACGPTVYGPIHVGNARPFVVFALFKRFLEHEGYEVTLVENITDVNDKIYAAARDQAVPSAKLAAQMAQTYIADTDRLGLGRPDHEPLASQTMAAIVSLIEDLIRSGHAYEAAGDVYFRVRSFDGYGKLSNRKFDDMEGGEERSELKEDQLDFALWKAQKEGEDTAWGSPWGLGRPGWHIEFSAMAEQLLGHNFDIHGGGSDLIFPHHENEIAQTEAARQRPLAHYWMHNGMVRFGEEKMSKSVGNIRLLSVALDEYGRDVLIMYFLSAHYRRPIEYSVSQLEQAASSLERVLNFCRALRGVPAEGAGDWALAYMAKFFATLADDFNTPEALAQLFELIGEGNRRLTANEPLGDIRGALLEMLTILGLETLLGEDEQLGVELKELLERREAARQAKDFAAADRIRDQVAARGYEIRDSSAGPRVVRRI